MGGDFPMNPRIESSNRNAAFRRQRRWKRRPNFCRLKAAFRGMFMRMSPIRLLARVAWRAPPLPQPSGFPSPPRVRCPARDVRFANCGPPFHGREGFRQGSIKTRGFAPGAKKDCRRPSRNYGQAVAVQLTILGSGSSGNCAYLETAESRILIDAGFSLRQIRQRLAAIGRAPEGLTGILITHEHSDHVNGLPMLSSETEHPHLLQSRDEGGNGMAASHQVRLPDFHHGRQF